MNYKNIYDGLIENARKRNKLEGYKEKHHIIPKCMNGNNDKSNLVELTAREHFIAHKLLVKIYPNNEKLIFSLNIMLYGKRKKYFEVSSKEYQNIKELFIKTRKGYKHDKKTILKMKKTHTGMKRSKTHRENISKYRMGKKTPLNVRKKISNSHKGKKLSDEHKEKIRHNQMKKIKINDIIYNSITESASKLQVSIRTISRRLKSDKNPEYEYI